MKRRDFLRRAGLSAGAASAMPGVAIVGAPGAPGAPARPSPASRRFDPGDWSSVRDQFALTRSKIHMSMFLPASHPKPVAEAIARHRQAFDENPADYWHEHFRTVDAVQRAAAAEYMGCDPNHVALTDSTTMGLGLLYNTIDVRDGQEILTTTHDHYSTHMALQHRAERTGAKVRYAPLYDDPRTVSVDEVTTRLRDAIADNTRVLAVTWVHSSTGVKLPLREMAEIVRDANRNRDAADRVLFCVDGVHGFGIDDVTMADLGVDAFVAGAHKWIFGPRGTGVMWAKPEVWSVAHPVIPSFGPNYGAWLGLITPDQVPVGDLMTPGGFHSFEHRWALDKAFRFQLDIGKDRVQERIHRLNAMLKQALADMPHVDLLTPMSPELSAGINCFIVDGLSEDETVARLAERNIIASTSPYRVSYARLCPSLVNDEREIERTAAAVRDLA